MRLRSIAHALWQARQFVTVMVSRCPLFRGNFVLKSAVGSTNLVRCPESRSAHFSEVVSNDCAWALVAKKTAYICAKLVAPSFPPITGERGRTVLPSVTPLFSGLRMRSTSLLMNFKKGNEVTDELVAIFPQEIY